MIGIYILASVLVLNIAFFAGYYIICKKNAKHNKEADGTPTLSTENRIINDQNGATGRAFVYGIHKAGFNACETIAAHNAKVLLGVPSRLSDTVTDFQKSLAMVFYGIFGSYTYMTGTVLRREGLMAKRVKLSELDKAGVYIVSFWNRRPPWHGIHTVALEFDGKKYTTYNLHGTGRSTELPPSVYAKRYICGYRISKENQNGNNGIEHV